MQRNGFSNIFVEIIIALAVLGISGYVLISRQSVTSPRETESAQPTEEAQAPFQLQPLPPSSQEPAPTKRSTEATGAENIPLRTKIYGDPPDRILVTFEAKVPEWTRVEDKVYLVVNGYLEEIGGELIRDLPMEQKEKNVWISTFRESENMLLKYRYSRNWGEGMTDGICRRS